MKKATRIFLLALVICLLATPVLAGAGTVQKDVSYRDITIEIDGVQLNPTDVNGVSAEPFIINGTTYVPVRALSEALGYDVVWNDAASKISVTTPADGSSMKVTSNLVGLVDTYGKTTAKNYTILSQGPGDQTLRYYNDEGKRVAYDDQDAFHKNPGVSYVGSAEFKLRGMVDDSKIDSSSAVVKIVDNSMAPASDYILSDAASKLSGSWKNGRYIYTLSGEDIQLNQYGIGHALTNPNANNEPNSGFEWNTMGGDGNGVYYIDLEVSGITYDGKELDPEIFTVEIFCYGRENSMESSNFLVDYAPLDVDTSYTSGVDAADEVQWNWFTKNESATEPYMNDTYADYISVIWPAGTNASAISASDVTVTLADEYGKTRVLEPETAYGEKEYTVIPRAGETVVAVTYEQWSWYPAYSKMTVSVNNGTLQAEKTFDISSVNAQAAHAQQGGGEQDGVPYVTSHTYNGVTGWEIGKGVDVTYNLSTERDGKTWYYDGEKLIDSSTLPTHEVVGWGGRTSVETDLSTVTFTISNAAEDTYGILANRHIGVNGGHTYSVGTNMEDMLVNVAVDGQTYSMKVSTSVSTADGFTAEFLRPGYNTQNTAQSKWGYPARFQSGWLQNDSPKPTGSPYVNGYYGYTPEQGSNPLYAASVANAETAGSQGQGGPGGGPNGGGPGGGGPGGGPNGG